MKTARLHKYNNSEPLSIMTVNEINDFVAGGSRSCYAPANDKGMTLRIVQARTRGGIIQGRTLTGQHEWVTIGS